MHLDVFALLGSQHDGMVESVRERVNEVFSMLLFCIFYSVGEIHLNLNLNIFELNLDLSLPFCQVRELELGVFFLNELELELAIFP